MDTARRLTLCLAAGMDKNMIVSRGGETRLHVAAAQLENRAEQEIFLLLLSRGADANAVDNFGLTPLHYLTRYDPPRQSLDTTTFGQALTMLLKHGADINAIGEFDGTPLWESVVDCKPEVVRMLLKHGADPNKGNFRGETPLDRITIAVPQPLTTSIVFPTG
jgi:ankyrin repeat protein